MRCEFVQRIVHAKNLLFTPERCHTHLRRQRHMRDAAAASIGVAPSRKIDEYRTHDVPIRYGSEAFGRAARMDRSLSAITSVRRWHERRNREQLAPTMKQIMVLVLGLFVSFGCGTIPGQDVRYEPTPMPVVRAMLELADVGPQDLVYDLGSGDGRIPITAAKSSARVAWESRSIPHW